MTKLAAQLHSDAERLAISLGPRVTNLNGSQKTVYYLSKREVKKFFTECGFNTRGRRAWLDRMVDFREVWGELVAPENSLKTADHEDSWAIVFMHPNKVQLMSLKMHAENVGVPSLAVEA